MCCATLVLLISNCRSLQKQLTNFYSGYTEPKNITLIFTTFILILRIGDAKLKYENDMVVANVKLGVEDLKGIVNL